MEHLECTTTAYRYTFELASDIPVDIMLVIERGIILLYDRTSTCSDINKNFLHRK